MSRSKNRKTVVVIVNYNSKEIFTLVKYLVNSRIYTIVVNNGKLFSIGRSPFLRVVRNSSNRGFAAGCNQGIKIALRKSVSHILLLNPDAKINKQQIKALTEDGAEICGPVLKYRKNGESIYDFGGRINWFIGRPKHLETSRLNNFQHSRPDFISGAVMCIRANVFRKIGFFNERYFLFFEDVDFCTRALNRGMELKICRNVLVDHKLSETIGRNSLKKHYQNLRSNLLFIHMSVPTRYKPAALFYWLILVLWTSSKFFLMGR